MIVGLRAEGCDGGVDCGLGMGRGTVAAQPPVNDNHDDEQSTSTQNSLRVRAIQTEPSRAERANRLQRNYCYWRKHVIVVNYGEKEREDVYVHPQKFD